MTSLSEVAAEYEREARRARRAKTRDQILRQAQGLKNMIDNRALMADELRLHLGLPVSLPGRWCQRRGYQAVMGFSGLAIQRDDEVPRIAMVGDTLRWDGEEIHIITS